MDAAHDLEALAKRVEAAAGPDRELDAVIAATAGLRVVDEGHPLGRCCYDRNGISIVLPRYTASLDAAMTLVPKGCGMNMTTGADELPTLIKHEDLPSSARVFFLSKRIDALAACNTLPLAICAASLRALSQGVNDDHA